MNLEKQIVDIVKQIQEERALADKRIKQLFLAGAGAHASSHEIGGADLVNHDNLTNFVAGEHFLQSAITQVGTIATGVWNGTPLTAKYYEPYHDEHTRASAFSSTTAGAYVDTGVVISLTPTFDCRALMTVFWMMKKSVTGGYLLGALYEVTDDDTLGVGYHQCKTANEYLQFCLVACKDLTASTAYTFKLRIYQQTAGTMTVAQFPYILMTMLVFGR